jgi:uncharacterized RDD family membrane protein YckC
MHGVKIGVMLGWLAGWQAAVGATPGMMLLRLRVLGPSGEAKPSLRAALIRNSVIMLGSVGPILANAGVNAVLEIAALLIHLAIGITISKAPTRQGIHDRLAGATYVVRRVPASTNTR